MSGKMCPRRLRIVVDIVERTLIGYFSLSGAPLLDLSELAVRDYYSGDYNMRVKWLPVIYQHHTFSNIVSCHGGVWKINWYNEAAQQTSHAKLYSTDIVHQLLASNLGSLLWGKREPGTRCLCMHKNFHKMTRSVPVSTHGLCMYTARQK